MATKSLILIIVLVCLVTHYKKMNRCTARFRRPIVHYDKCYFNNRETDRDRYMNVEVTPVQDSESYRPSPTLELSNLHQYSEVQDVLTLTHYTEPTDTRGHQQSETHVGDILTLHAQERHYSVVDVQVSLASSVRHLNQSAKAIEGQLTSEQVEQLNDGYITPIDHYSIID
ncbi:uncharacterized protein LOC131941035 [Physella acuta]|uniref:uncharacterized protein LOC131941035 n=1 Tax=Physella acuta TaxID=109671 RepID=UPI0027DE0F64|nr:uncharacterized protein LOC131941035 [Physella acuta]